MEELRISSDDLDEALCIIENYKILKLEKFEQGKFLKLVPGISGPAAPVRDSESHLVSGRVIN